MGKSRESADFEKLESVKKIYQMFPADIDTRAVGSSKRFQRKWHEEKLQAVVENLGLEKGKALDLGCGSGGMTFLLARRFPALEITGADFNEQAIAFANRRKKRENVPNTAFVSCCAEKLDFPAKHFDAVIAWDVLDHCVNPVSALNEINRVLKKGGKVFLTVENYHSLFPLVEFLWDKLGGGRNYLETHLTHFTKRKLNDYLLKSGFAVEKLFTIHNASTLFYLFSGYFPKNLDDFLKKRGWGMTIFCIAWKK